MRHYIECLKRNISQRVPPPLLLPWILSNQHMIGAESWEEELLLAQISWILASCMTQPIATKTLDVTPLTIKYSLSRLAVPTFPHRPYELDPAFWDDLHRTLHHRDYTPHFSQTREIQRVQARHASKYARAFEVATR